MEESTFSFQIPKLFNDLNHCLNAPGAAVQELHGQAAALSGAEIHELSGNYLLCEDYGK